jgi:hypothetical protein
MVMGGVAAGGLIFAPISSRYVVWSRRRYGSIACAAVDLAPHAAAHVAEHLAERVDVGARPAGVPRPHALDLDHALQRAFVEQRVQHAALRRADAVDGDPAPRSSEDARGVQVVGRGEGVGGEERDAAFCRARGSACTPPRWPTTFSCLYSPPGMRATCPSSVAHCPTTRL